MSTQAQHGAAIAKLVASLRKEVDAYLAKADGAFGEPNEKRKQLQILAAYISVGLDCLNLPNTATHRQWLAKHPQSGLVIK